MYLLSMTVKQTIPSLTDLKQQFPISCGAVGAPTARCLFLPEVGHGHLTAARGPTVSVPSPALGGMAKGQASLSRDLYPGLCLAQ